MALYLVCRPLSCAYGRAASQAYQCLPRSCLVAFQDRAFMPGHGSPDTRVGTPPRAYSFNPGRVFLLDDPAAEKPHIGATVTDSSEAEEGQVLRSEVVAAVALLRLQFFRGDYSSHHTLPVSAQRHPRAHVRPATLWPT